MTGSQGSVPPGGKGDAGPEVVELERLDALGDTLSARAAARGAVLVWRAQVRSLRSVTVQGGRIESASSSRSTGHGVQIFGEDGITAFGARDDLDPDEAAKLLERVLATAQATRGLDLHPVSVPELPRSAGRAVPAWCAAFSRISLSRAAQRLHEIEAAVRAQSPGVLARASYTADLDAWRIRRSDGSDVIFAMPRVVVRVALTAAGPKTSHTVGVSASGPDPDLPWKSKTIEPMLRRAASAARLALQLADAPAHPAGPSPLVLDYALAKGLAHEAFGHASEADGFRSSVLAQAGRFRAGESVGAKHVSIVDEPLEGDHAWQPYSANGLPRGRATIVDHGVLREGLVDPWTATERGSPFSDAGRSESFRDPPLPRMSNIRIEVDQPQPAPGPFEDYGPEEVHDLMASAGLFRRHPRVAFLSGYSGGQVNPATGDFVFHCKAIYSLSPDGVRLHRPAVLSGSMFGALAAIREGFGPLRLDAIGTCGKWGQHVPSSGGCHYFLVLDSTPSVRLGGAAA